MVVVTLWCGMWVWPDCKDLWAHFTKEPISPKPYQTKQMARSLHLKDFQCRVTSTGFRSTSELQVSSLLFLGHPTLFGTSSGFGLEPRSS